MSSERNKKQKIIEISPELSDFQAETIQLINFAKDANEMKGEVIDLKFESPKIHMDIEHKDQLTERHKNVISSFTNKGGVGKTSLVVMLAESLHFDNKFKNILVMDFDSQQSLTSMLETTAEQNITFNEIDSGLINPTSEDSWQNHNVIGYLRKSELRLRAQTPEFKNYITNRSIRSKIDYMKGHMDHDYVNNEISAGFRRETLNFITGTLIELIKICSRKYDLVLLDLSPSLTPINIVLLKQSSHIISPVLPDLHATLSAKMFNHRFTLRNSDYKNIPDNKPEFSGFIVNRVRHYGSEIIKEMKRNMVKLQTFAQNNNITGIIGTVKFMPSLSELLQMNEGSNKNLISAGESHNIPEKYMHLYNNVRNSIRDILNRILNEV